MANDKQQTTDIAAMLAEFHAALGDEPGRGNAGLRQTLHHEEHRELALELRALRDRELEGERPSSKERGYLARELADVVYLAFGTAHAFDIDLNAAVAEVHRAAMSKLDPATMVVREDGKVLKPSGFVPPDMAEAVR